MSILNEINFLNTEIQEIENDLANLDGYYILPDKLRELLALMDVSGSNDEFNEEIKFKSLDPLIDSIKESQYPVPDNWNKGKYKMHRIRKMKVTAKAAVWCFNHAWNQYHPDIVH